MREWYFDWETSRDIRAHLYDYREQRQIAAHESRDADWMFFAGAVKAIQRLLHLERGRKRTLQIPREHRQFHSDSKPTMCWVCMGSGIHPQNTGGGCDTKHLDRLCAGVREAAAKLKDPPTCPLCDGIIDYGVYIGSEKVSPSCRDCNSSFGSKGFATLEQAVRFMCGPEGKRREWFKAEAERQKPQRADQVKRKKGHRKLTTIVGKP